MTKSTIIMTLSCLFVFGCSTTTEYQGVPVDTAELNNCLQGTGLVAGSYAPADSCHGLSQGLYDFSSKKNENPYVEFNKEVCQKRRYAEECDSLTGLDSLYREHGEITAQEYNSGREVLYTACMTGGMIDMDGQDETGKVCSNAANVFLNTPEAEKARDVLRKSCETSYEGCQRLADYFGESFDKEAAKQRSHQNFLAQQQAKESKNAETRAINHDLELQKQRKEMVTAAVLGGAAELAGTVGQSAGQILAQKQMAAVDNTERAGRGGGYTVPPVVVVPELSSTTPTPLSDSATSTISAPISTSATASSNLIPCAPGQTPVQQIWPQRGQPGYGTPINLCNSAGTTPSGSPPDTGSSSTGTIPSTGANAQYDGTPYDHCITSFYDPQWYMWLSYQNSCSATLVVVYLGNHGDGPHGQVNDLQPGGKANTGLGKSDIDPHGGLSRAVCRSGYLPVDTNGNYWQNPNAEYRCKLGS